MTPIRNLSDLLRSLHPELNPGTYAFASLAPGANADALQPLATFREKEGLTVIVDEDVARAANLPVLFRAAWITLSVNSDLEAVGLTAAVSAALMRANISCNIVAAAWHDHVFVPLDAALDAMAVLSEIQRQAEG